MATEHGHVECWFCGRPQGSVKWLIANDEDVHICDACLRLAETATEQGAAQGEHVRFAEVACSICGLPASRAHHLVCANGRNICGECVDHGLAMAAGGESSPVAGNDD